MEIVIAQTQQGPMVVDQVKTLTAQRDPLLIGIRIRVYDAARRYTMPQSTLTRWANRGLLRVLHRAPGVLELDEADVAMVCALYRRLREHASAQQAGRWLDTLLA
jgi:hypothetical protein